MIPSLIGAAIGTYSSYMDSQKKNKLVAQEQARLEKADRERASDREGIQRFSPRDLLMQQLGIIEEGKSNAVSSASNVAAGNITNSGLGGDIASPTALGKTAPIVQALGAFTGVKSEAYGQNAQMEAQKRQELERNTDQGLAIEDRQIYNENNDFLYPVITGALGGANAVSSFMNLAKPGDKKVEGENNPLTPNDFQAQSLIPPKTRKPLYDLWGKNNAKSLFGDNSLYDNNGKMKFNRIMNYGS